MRFVDGAKGFDDALGGDVNRPRLLVGEYKPVGQPFNVSIE